MKKVGLLDKKRAMKKTIRQIFNEYGLTCNEASKRGVNYQTLYKQLRGLRPVGAKTAMRYHTMLGIPLYELRPDIWPPQLFGKNKQ